MEKELAVGRQLQLSLLPKSCPIATGWAFCDYYQSAKQVGGDYYDFIYFPDEPDKMGLVIADVSDKGVPAALFMVRAIAILRAQSGFEHHSNDYAERLFARLNDQLYEHNDAQQFLTAYCGILDLETLTVRYVNAGHNAPAIAIGDDAFAYRGEPINPFVGMIEGIRYRAGEMQLQPGSVLLLYTDGVTEAEDSKGDMLGDERLLARLNAAPARSARELVDAVFDDVTHFADGAQQSDDITVLAIRCPAS